MKFIIVFAFSEVSVILLTFHSMKEKSIRIEKDDFLMYARMLYCPSISRSYRITGKFNSEPCKISEMEFSCGID